MEVELLEHIDVAGNLFLILLGWPTIPPIALFATEVSYIVTCVGKYNS
jgi:hypothetical protein